MKYLISGGGTGGHIFPAISIANALRLQDPDCEILFVGAEGRMEMKRVPDAGYKIVGLKVQGFDRQNLLRNILVLWNLYWSMRKVRKIIRDFRPNVAIGVGGYASGAAMKVAQQMGIPVLIQEQNSFAGVTNKMLAPRAACICVAYEGMERFFPKDKIVVTGNPVRQDLFDNKIDRSAAFSHFGLREGIPTLLVIGGSLGARTINESMLNGMEALRKAGVQVIWQTGSYYYKRCIESVKTHDDKIKVTEFVKRMDYAYAVADVVISRAGASSISELCLLGKPSILVPSPNVAEDHQTHNARALSDRGAAILITDAEAIYNLVNTAVSLLSDDARRHSLSEEILKLALPDSANRIVAEINKLTK
ncbi:MAG: undecaprenyldiphospho-muramoylpentapeptide beta-N-acetylglucosaminyltransferase [Paludibacteraceae bacterium]|nr:undecaprenyldiphospho-muramoylpentapeptide beta-N-acetylglucosaminyltransferase [Paludibacteraceae bacterium]